MGGFRKHLKGHGEECGVRHYRGGLRQRSGPPREETGVEVSAAAVENLALVRRLCEDLMEACAGEQRDSLLGAGV